MLRSSDKVFSRSDSFVRQLRVCTIVEKQKCQEKRREVKSKEEGEREIGKGLRFKLASSEAPGPSPGHAEGLLDRSFFAYKRLGLW